MSMKSIIITGGAGTSTGGCGRYLAMRLAMAGNAVTIWDVQDEPGLEQVDQIRSKGGWASYVHCDICDESQVAEAVTKTYAQTGRIDALVNNAGWHLPEYQPIHAMSSEDWDRQMAVNLKGHFLVCKYTIPSLLDHGGVIVNVGATDARRGDDSNAAFAAAKAGLESLTRSIAAQYGRDGIRCNCVVPGRFLNDQMEKMLPVIKKQRELLEVSDRQSLLAPGHGRGVQVAQAIEFLLSDASAWMTGESLVLDGGALSHMPTWTEMRCRMELES